MALTQEATTRRLRQVEAKLNKIGPQVATLERKSRGITSAHARAAGLERTVAQLEGQLSNAINRLEQLGPNAGPTQTNAIMAEVNRVDQKVDGLWQDLNDQVTKLGAQVTAIGDHVQLLANDRVFEIDFDGSTYVPLRGSVTAHVDWLPALLVGVVAGIVTGVLTNIYVEEWKDSYVIAAGVIVGVASFLVWSSFERLQFHGHGNITWATRPTMEEEADELARQNACQLPPPPPPPVDRTSVQPAVSQNVGV